MFLEYQFIVDLIKFISCSEVFIYFDYMFNIVNQVCVYKDGEVIIDIVVGVFGKYDFRLVQFDLLFFVFLVIKGIIVGLLYWLVDNRWGYIILLYCYLVYYMLLNFQLQQLVNRK